MIYTSENTSTEIEILNITDNFSKNVFAAMASNGLVLKEIRDSVLGRDKQMCRELQNYMNSYWKNLNVSHVSRVVDDREANPHAMKNAMNESLHMSHPGSLRGTDVVYYVVAKQQSRLSS